MGNAPGIPRGKENEFGSGWPTNWKIGDVNKLRSRWVRHCGMEFGLERFGSKGFEGLFGHLASSKEEVLKKRGPMPALEYEAVPGDDIDQKVQYLARWLPPKLGNDLKIYRVSRGQYQIGDEDVELKWHSWVRPDGVQCKEVFVFMSKDDWKS